MSPWTESSHMAGPNYQVSREMDSSAKEQPHLKKNEMIETVFEKHPFKK